MGLLTSTSSSGFQVGARNRHPWGTENRIVQFSSSFIELIALGEKARRRAARRDVLQLRRLRARLPQTSRGSRHAGARQRACGRGRGAVCREGIGAFEPFFFERTGRRPDGSEIQVAFTLAFARAPNAPLAGFFVCQQHFPENFWNAAFQVHPNGAQDVAVVALSAPEPDAEAAFLRAFTGVEPTSPAEHDLDLSAGRRPFRRDDTR